MDFSTASLVDQVIYEMRQADYPRATNRALINRLFEGFPPWTNEEAESARINTNVNFLDGPKLAADARRSYYNAFVKPADYFTLTLNFGPDRMRPIWSGIVSKEINAIMKNSLCYFETVRSQLAMTVLHGVGPVHWPNQEKWKPRATGIEDLLIPSNTLLSMENLCHFAIFRQYTAVELSGMIERKNVDPAWNIELARKCVKWAMAQPAGQITDWDSLSPEKLVDQLKQDGVYYSSDVVPTIRCWDFYFYSDEGKKHGWRRRMVLDTPPQGEIDDKKLSLQRLGLDAQQWLYNGKNRVYADDLSQVLHFQFGDLSAKAPFKYHSVRSLGWLIYAICNLQNRLRCKINDATFENLLNYFRVSGADDAERLTKIDLHNYGVVPEGVDFVSQNDRWQINHNLVMGTMADNRQQMNEAAAQFREGRDTGVQKEKTATEIMAEVNAANALVGTMLSLAYTYQKGQYTEIVRRFMRPNSTDPEVRKFRMRVIKQGVPPKALDPDLWDVAPEQVLGSGNKTLQIAMAEKLMAVRPLLDPDAQRDVLRMYVQANSDDPRLATRWVPTKPILVTESTHDAELMVGPLMAGVQVQPRKGQDPVQVVLSLMKSIGAILQRIQATTGLPTLSELAGLVNMAMTIQLYLQMASQDEASGDLVKGVTKELQAIFKLLQNFRQQIQQQQQQNGQNIDPKVQRELMLTKAKVESMQAQAQTKAQIEMQKNQQRMAQSEARFRQDQRQKDAEHMGKLEKDLTQSQIDRTIQDAEAAAEIQNERMKAALEPTQEETPPNA
jgi:hypothetical protein